VHHVGIFVWSRKGEFIPVHAMKAYGGVEVQVTPFNLDTWWKWVVGFKFRPLYSCRKWPGTHRVPEPLWRHCRRDKLSPAGVRHTIRRPSSP